jgi:hypothetical protein
MNVRMRLELARIDSEHHLAGGSRHRVLHSGLLQRALTRLARRVHPHGREDVAVKVKGGERLLRQTPDKTQLSLLPFTPREIGLDTAFARQRLERDQIVRHGSDREVRGYQLGENKHRR